MQLLVPFNQLHVAVGITIIAATAVSFFFKPILRVRYLMPAVGVFWLAISILVGRTKQDKLLIVSLFLIMILGISGAFALLDFNNAA